MGFFLLEILKTTFKMKNLTQDKYNQGIYSQNQGTFFQFLKKGRGDLPPLPPSSYAPEHSNCYSNVKNIDRSITSFNTGTIYR